MAQGQANNSQRLATVPAIPSSLIARPKPSPLQLGASPNLRALFSPLSPPSPAVPLRGPLSPSLASSCSPALPASSPNTKRDSLLCDPLNLDGQAVPPSLLQARGSMLYPERNQAQPPIAPSPMLGAIPAVALPRPTRAQHAGEGDNGEGNEEEEGEEEEEEEESAVCRAMRGLLPPELASQTRAHQMEGTAFMLRAVLGVDVVARNAPVECLGGCILADDMGLGKTLQTITFLLLASSQALTRPHAALRRTTVVCPASALLFWQAEINRWWHVADVHGTPHRQGVHVVAFDMDALPTNYDKVQALRAHFNAEGPSIVLVSYEAYRDLTHAFVPPPDAASVPSGIGREQDKLVATELGGLLERAFLTHLDCIVLDEAHRIRSPHSKLSQALARCQCKRRVVLTGYPLQNHLMEYWCMVRFALGASAEQTVGSQREFKEIFYKPIHSASSLDANESAITDGRERAMALSEKLKPCMLRRSRDLLQRHLGLAMHHTFLSVRLTELQLRLYAILLTFFKSTFAKHELPSFLLLCHCTRLLCNHPDIFVDYVTACTRQAQGEESATVPPEEPEGIPSLGMGDVIERGANASPDTPQPDRPQHPRHANGNGGANAGHHDHAGGALTEAMATALLKDVHAVTKKFSPSALRQPGLSGKMALLCAMLKRCARLREHCIVFSHSLSSLKFIREHIVPRMDKAVGGWKKQGEGDFFEGVDVHELRGDMPLVERTRTIKHFQSSHPRRLQLMLVSTRCGAEGINLCAASRVFLLDVSWNPSHESQAASRVYRYGQSKDVHVYRFITNGTLETKMFYRQIQKGVLFRRIVDDSPCMPPFSRKDLLVSHSSLAELLVDQYGQGGNSTTTLASRVHSFAHDAMLRDVVRKFDANAKPITDAGGVVLDAQQEESLYLEDFAERCKRVCPNSLSTAIRNTDHQIRKFRDGASAAAKSTGWQRELIASLQREDAAASSRPTPSPPTAPAARRPKDQQSKRKERRARTDRLLAHIEGQAAPFHLKQLMQATSFAPADVHCAMNWLCQQGKARRVSRHSWVHAASAVRTSRQARKRRLQAKSAAPAKHKRKRKAGKEGEGGNDGEGETPPRQATPLMLLDLVARKHGQTLEFAVDKESGPAHAPVFAMSTAFRGTRFQAEAGSKKAGKQALARLVLDHLGVHTHHDSRITPFK